jgi:hypothetical protein
MLWSNKNHQPIACDGCSPQAQAWWLRWNADRLEADRQAAHRFRSDAVGRVWFLLMFSVIAGFWCYIFLTLIEIMGVLANSYTQCWNMLIHGYNSV